MGRKIGKDVRNELRIHDPISGSVIELYYRIPTSEERVKYGSNSITFKDGQVEITSIAARQKWGPEILTGIGEGSFEIDGKPLSESDPNWKALVAESAMDLIEALAEYVFEGRKILGTQEEFTEKNS